MIIKPFRGDYAFLSNMWECRVVYNMIEFPSSEHAYQASKYEDPAIRVRVANLLLPREAKSFPRDNPGLTVRRNFHQLKLEFMKAIVKAKFTQNPKLLELLKETAPHDLVEEGWWHDGFWGTCTCGNKDGRHPQCLRPGANNLGIILMRERKWQCSTRASVQEKPLGLFDY